MLSNSGQSISVLVQFAMEPALKIGAEFDSFKQFEESLKRYEQDTFSNYVVASGGLMKSEDEGLNAKFKYKRVTYHCKFAGAAVQLAARKRNTSTYKQKCSAKIYIATKKKNGLLKLVVSNMACEHNHEMSSDVYASLPKQRHALLEDNEAMLQRMLPLKVNRQLLQTQLINSQPAAGPHKNVILKDIHNFAAKRK